MLSNPKDIKEIRKKLGLTQNELAKRANVSQSLVAKVESGLLDPTYSNAMKIFTALNDLNIRKEIKAEKIMNEKIISIAPHSSIKETITKLKKHSFSQLPVIEDNHVVGVISESVILNSIIEKKGNNVIDIMENAPPVISTDTPIEYVSNLLKYYSLVIVSKKGKIVGVITKTDVLEKLYKSK